jgi:hypothetical protein
MLIQIAINEKWQLLPHGIIFDIIGFDNYNNNTAHMYNWIRRHKAWEEEGTRGMKAT